MPLFILGFIPIDATISGNLFDCVLYWFGNLRKVCITTCQRAYLHHHKFPSPFDIIVRHLLTCYRQTIGPTNIDR